MTNRRVTDATVSALYAHSASRFWECNNVSREAQMCKDIGRQLMEDEPGRNLNVSGWNFEFILFETGSSLGFFFSGASLSPFSPLFSHFFLFPYPIIP